MGEDGLVVVGGRGVCERRGPCGRWVAYIVYYVERGFGNTFGAGPNTSIFRLSVNASSKSSVAPKM